MVKGLLIFSLIFPSYTNAFYFDQIYPSLPTSNSFRVSPLTPFSHLHVLFCCLNFKNLILNTVMIIFFFPFFPLTPPIFSTSSPLFWLCFRPLNQISQPYLLLFLSLWVYSWFFFCTQHSFHGFFTGPFSLLITRVIPMPGISGSSEGQCVQLLACFPVLECPPPHLTRSCLELACTGVLGSTFVLLVVWGPHPGLPVY